MIFLFTTPSFKQLVKVLVLVLVLVIYLNCHYCLRTRGLSLSMESLKTFQVDPIIKVLPLKSFQDEIPFQCLSPVLWKGLAIKYRDVM